MKLQLLLLSLFLISLTSAYYPGETINVTNELNNSNLVYTLIGNETPVNLNLSVTNEQIWINFPDNLQPQSFDIVFIEEVTNEVQVVKHSGKTKVVTKEINNTIEVEKPIYIEINKTENNTNEEVEVEEHIHSEYGFWYYVKLFIATIIFSAIVIPVFFIIFGIIRNYKRKKEDKEHGKEEKF